MKRLLLFSISTLFSIVLNAQGYDYALGLRVNDYAAGITYKKFISEKNALDFTLNSDFDNGFGLTGLYEIHEPSGITPGLNWYYGCGGHIGLWSGNYGQGFGNYSVIGLGVDGVVGIEYVVGPIPFAFSIDYIPSFSLYNQTKPKNYPENWDWDRSWTEFGFRNWTIGVKYTFGGSQNEEVK